MHHTNSKRKCHDRMLSKKSPPKLALCLFFLLTSLVTLVNTNACSAGGTYLNSNNVCADCEKGKFSLGSVTACELCVAGKYQAMTGGQSCNKCEKGYYSNFAGASACSPCPIDQTTYNYSSRSVDFGMSSCSYCPEGFFLQDNSCRVCQLEGFYCTQSLQRECKVPTLGSQYISSQCTRISDTVLSPCSQCPPPSQYIEVSYFKTFACTLTTDTVCQTCTKCSTELFKEYQLAPCTSDQNAICSTCNNTAGDMVLGIGKCNQCPAGSFFSPHSEPVCKLCPSGTFSKSSDSNQCTPCPSGFTSSVGASMCVKNCPLNYFSPSGQSNCVALHDNTDGFQTAVSAWDSVYPLISAASALITADDSAQVSYKYFLVATKRPYAYSSEIKILAGDGLSWSVAGNGYRSVIISDGKGMQASLALITSIAPFDADNSLHSRYLLTEHDPFSAKGYLRCLTLTVSTTSTASTNLLVINPTIISAEGETRLLTYGDEVADKIMWVYPTQAVYDAWQNYFFVMDTVLNIIAKIRILPSANLITSCALLISFSNQGNYYSTLFNPVSIAIFHHKTALVEPTHAPQSLIILDNDKIIAFEENNLKTTILCGGGWRVLPLEKGSSMQCNQVDLSKSGAKQILISPDPSSSTSNIIYILLTSPSAITSSAVAKIVMESDVINPLQTLSVSIFWMFPSEDSPESTITISTPIPLHFISHFAAPAAEGEDSLLKGLYLVESRGIIMRLAEATTCLCATGLYCDSKSTMQCLEPPLGTYTSDTWASEPIICPSGTIGDGAGGCSHCPAGYVPNYRPPTLDGYSDFDIIQNQLILNKNSEDLSLSLPWYCQASCAQGYTFDDFSKQCIQGCSASLGLYQDSLHGNCLSCWLGSESTGGIGPESCIPCIPGQYGVSPGVCSQCPSSFTSWSFGSTICMPNPQGNIPPSKACADGVFPQAQISGLPSDLQQLACPALEIPTTVTPFFLNNYTGALARIFSLTASRDGILFMFSSSSSIGNSTLGNTNELFIFDTVQIAKQTTGWQKIQFSSPPPSPVYDILQVCETCQSSSYSLYHSSKFGTCIYKTTVNLYQATATVERFKGDCSLEGRADNGLLPAIHSMALMETDQLSPILYISALIFECAEVLSVSTYDGSITHFASRDALKYPISLLNTCHLSPLVLASSKGTKGTLYTALEDKIFATQVTGSNAVPASFLKEDPIFQVGTRGFDSTRIVAITIHQYTTTTTNPEGNAEVKHHLVVVTENGNVHSIPASAYAVNGQYSTLISLGNATSVPVVSSIVLIGRRIFYPDNRDSKVYQILLSNLNVGCVGGFVIPDTDRNIRGVCMQTGKGFYTDFDGTLQSCPPGSIGIKAGASLSVQCSACPSGTIAPSSASAYCNHCPPGFFSDPFNTECVSTCPLGTYRPSAFDNLLSCVPCQAGYSTVPTTTVAASRSALDAPCFPCAEGTFSNELTSWLCSPCPTGYTSPPGAHNCVKICAENTCALDGEECISLTRQYKVLSQIYTPNSGQGMLGLTVDKRGGVFYTNGNNILYYFDDCPSYLDICNKQGRDLLQANKYTEYSFSALAICNVVKYLGPSSIQCPQLETKSGNTKIFYARTLYVSSLTYSTVYTLQICQDVYGDVDVDSTVAGNGLALLAGSRWAGFGDGPFTTAMFNGPVDLELNARCTLLYLSDFFNHKIRLLNLTSEMVTSVAGSWSNPSCWKMGNAICPLSAAQQSCTSDNGCASISYPSGIGLSADEKDLYISANTYNALVKISNVNAKDGGTMDYACRFSAGKSSGTEQNCNLNLANSKGCMLFRAFDVAAVANFEMYVGAKQGITKIYSDNQGQSLLCQQIAGNYFDIYTSNLRDGIRPTDPQVEKSISDSVPNSLVNIPFKLAFAKDTGVLYFADLMNGAIRRILIKPSCTCPSGTSLVQSAASCYNPSPSWSKKPLPSCQKPGYYALEGDLTCFRKCSDALQQGLTAAPCLVTPDNPQFATLMYSQLLGDLSPPQSTLQSDWYGSIPQTSQTNFEYKWDSIFQSNPPVTYRQGKNPGRAPLGRRFTTLTFSPSQKCWFEETSYALQPVEILPGLWFPCKTYADNGYSTCSCPAKVNSFEPLPLTLEEKEARAIAPKRWQALRAATMLSKAQYFGPIHPRSSTNDCSLNTAATTTQSRGYTDGFEMLFAISDNSGCSHSVQSRSMFMIFGLGDHTLPCPETAAEGGPCFPSLMSHIRRQASPISESMQDFELTNTNAWDKCYLGWPAHYFCPDGYIWIVPSPPSAFSGLTCNPITEHATCLSCTPGTYSFTNLNEKKETGGPYLCLKCSHGSYSSSVGSSVCLNCPVGKYASYTGATVCNSCPAAKYTVIPKAYSAAQCVSCLPGTGNCRECVEGTYQNNRGEIKCLLTPPGFYTSQTNASEPTPCPPGYYQDEAGQTACLKCTDINTYTRGSASTACERCEKVNGCSMALDNKCGKGCGLNQYWDGSACMRCPKGTINTKDPCSSDAASCWQNPNMAYYVSSQNNYEVTMCPLGSQANINFDGCDACIAGSYSDSASQGCKSCRQGKYSVSPSSSTCALCPAGQTNENAGRTTCSKCPSGMYTGVAGASACVACPAGQYSSSTGSTLCTLCGYSTFNRGESMTNCNETCDNSAGYFSLPGDTACKYCDGGVINISFLCQGCGLGQYLNSDNGGRQCVDCPVGFVNLYNTSARNIDVCVRCASPTAYAPSTTSCVESALGHIPNTTHNGQDPCPPGSFRNETQITCTLCSPGMFNQHKGKEACSYCEPGSFAQDYGTENCPSCSFGQVSKEPGSVSCQSCDAGKYAQEGNNCTLCAANTYSEEGFVVCVSCTLNTYSEEGATACSLCPAGKVLNRQKKCDLCAPGKYMVFDDRNSIYSCELCNVGKFMSFSSGGTTAALCAQCSAGLVALNEGSSACSACPRGKFSDYTLVSSCFKCPVGKYNNRDDLGVCLECPQGTFSDSTGSSKCSNCPLGTYQNLINSSACAQCSPGTFANASGSTGCLSCLLRPNTFNPLPGQSSCRDKIAVCTQGFYVKHTYDNPLADNSCEQCVACGTGQLTIAYFGSETRVFSEPETINSLISNVCDGTGEAPLYQCIDNTPRPGQYLHLDQSVGASASNIGGRNINEFKQCQNSKYDSKKVIWVAWNDVTQCYVSCLYGNNSDALFRYTQSNPHVSITGQKIEDVENNIFLERMLDYVDEICTPCPLAAECPRGKFRPRGTINTDCGPECGIPRLCSPLAMMNGCVSDCSNAPPNADYTQGSSILGEDNCPWICNQGWHLTDDRNACHPCPDISSQISISESAATEMISAICGSNDYMLIPKKDCQPLYTSNELCKPCPHLLNGRSIGLDKNNERCRYQCYRGYFLISAEDTPQFFSIYLAESNETATRGEVVCIHCTVVWNRNWTICPVGTYLDQESCFLNGEPPACKPCDPNPSIAYTSNGGLNASKCKAICPPGFHTTFKSTGEYFSMSRGIEQLPYAADAKCVQCQPNDQRSCLRSNSSICFEGNFRNLSVPEDQIGSCVPCKKQSECKGAGFYYTTQCRGDEVVDAQCISCPPSLLQDTAQQEITKQFISYTDISALTGQARLQVISASYCPRVCVNNLVRDNDQCIPCKPMAFDLQQRLDPTKISQDNQCVQTGTIPPPCAFVFSHWNATPSIPWWNPATDTPWLMARPLIVGEPFLHRAGLCWACPKGMITGSKDKDLCTIIPGFIPPSDDLPIAKEQIPSVPEDMNVIWDSFPVFTPPPIMRINKKGRRLLQFNISNQSAIDPFISTSVDDLIMKSSSKASTSASNTSKSAISTSSGIDKTSSASSSMIYQGGLTSSTTPDTSSSLSSSGINKTSVSTSPIKQGALISNTSPKIYNTSIPSLTTGSETTSVVSYYSSNQTKGTPDTSVVDAKPCPYGYYKPSAGEGECYECPLGSSTITEGSVSKKSCMCKYGYYRAITSGFNNSTNFFCQPCPAETFGNISISVMASTSTTAAILITNTSGNSTFNSSNIIAKQQQQCFPCPVNQTTYGTTGATRCVCALGMIQSSATGLCEICPVGYYCKPCGDSNCSDPSLVQGIAKRLCFPGSSSPLGSYDISQCSCNAGATKKSRPKNPTDFYCQNVPMGAEVDITNGNIVCRKGWTVISKAEDGSVSECILCNLGQYADVDASNNLILQNNGKCICKPCPTGFFLASRYGFGVASCEKCPEGQTTNVIAAAAGSISLNNCTCPPSMAKINGKCQGCSSNQFVDPSNSSKCMDCPADSFTSLGSNQCLCKAGFYMSTQKSCILCPKGKYTPATPSPSSNNACISCPAKSTTSGLGQVGVGSCNVCDAGYIGRINIGCIPIIKF